MDISAAAAHVKASMRAIDILKDEHQVILRVLKALTRAVQALAQGHAVRPAFFVEVAGFLKGFTEGCHHCKEEDALFPALETKVRSEQSDLVGALRWEHARGQVYAESLRRAARQLSRGDESARAALISSAQAYAGLLFGHIEKEDNVLFPEVSQVLFGDEQQQLEERFRRLLEEEKDAGVDIKYLALAVALETEANALPAD